MITEDYVSFETAKLLREKGFDERCFSFYWEDGSLDANSHDKTTDLRNSTSSSAVAPTLQMAMRWLREEKHYYIQIMLDSWALGAHLGYYIVIQATDSDFEEISPIVDDIDDVFFETPEQAAEAAIKYCLENLV